MKISSRQAGGEQGLLFTLPAPALDLGSYHVIVVNISGGKDSQAALDETVRAAGAAGVRDRIVTVFADLGDEDEWPGTRELAAEHAAHYGLRHEVVCREVTGPDGQRVQQSLSEHIESRPQQKWPDAARRFCTSDLKRAPVRRLLTRLAAEQHAAGVTGRVRILNVLGLRAQESAQRALLAPWSHDGQASNRTVRCVNQWLPIHSWTAEQVWARIAEAGTRPHPIYAAGMPACRAGSASLLAAALSSSPPGSTPREPSAAPRWSAGWATTSGWACPCATSSPKPGPPPAPCPSRTGRRDAVPGQPLHARRPRRHGHHRAPRRDHEPPPGQPVTR